MEMSNIHSLSMTGATVSPVAASSNRQEQLVEASKGFEAVFLRQFLGQALKPLLHDTPGANSAGAGIYQGMITEAIADNLAESGEFGFSSMLQFQLAEAVHSDDAVTTSNKEENKKL
jgi:Rod binding domain-containing protein